MIDRGFVFILTCCLLSNTLFLFFVILRVRIVNFHFWHFILLTIALNLDIGFGITVYFLFRWFCWITVLATLLFKFCFIFMCRVLFEIVAVHLFIDAIEFSFNRILSLFPFIKNNGKIVKLFVNLLFQSGIQKLFLILIFLLFFFPLFFSSGKQLLLLRLI